MPADVMCHGCDWFVDKVEILEYDAHGRVTLCENCATMDDIEFYEREGERANGHLHS